MAGKSASDVTITNKEEVTLLATGLKVDYEVGGLASAGDVSTAAATIEVQSAALVATLQSDAKFSDLTGITNDFVVESTIMNEDPDSATGLATAGRARGWWLAGVAGVVMLGVHGLG